MRRRILLMAVTALSARLGSAQRQQAESPEPWSKIAPAEDNQVFERVLEYRKNGDFERAVAVAIEPVNGKQPDDFLLQATAMTYFQWAQANQSNKNRWVDLAVEYSERALQANPSNLVNRFNVGDSYMAAGMNLGGPQGCAYYQKSAQAFERLQVDPGLQGEWGMMEGERVRLAPYRQKLDQHLGNLQTLAAKCPGLE